MLTANTTLGQIEIEEPAAIGPQAYGGIEIEKIILRARQIHRERGGLFGYNFDDWARAWSESRGSSRDAREAASENGKEPVPKLKREVFEPCFECGS
jgi:hypothetical protein